MSFSFKKENLNQKKDIIKKSSAHAAAVIPAPQVVIAIIGPKGFVAGLASSW